MRSSSRLSSLPHSSSRPQTAHVQGSTRCLLGTTVTGYTHTQTKTEFPALISKTLFRTKDFPNCNGSKQRASRCFRRSILRHFARFTCSTKLGGDFLYSWSCACISTVLYCLCYCWVNRHRSAAHHVIETDSPVLVGRVIRTYERRVVCVCGRAVYARNSKTG